MIIVYTAIHTIVMFRCNECGLLQAKQYFSNDQQTAPPSKRKCIVCEDRKHLDWELDLFKKRYGKEQVRWSKSPESSDQFYELSIVPLWQHFDRKDCRKSPSSLLELSRHIFLDDLRHYYTETVTRMLNERHSRITNRICNAFKHDQQYGIFAALAFRKFADRKDGFRDAKHRRLWLKGSLTNDSQIIDKCFESALRGMLPSTLGQTPNRSLLNFAREASTNKKWDATAFCDENIKLKWNPIHPDLHRRSRFVSFLSKHTFLIGCLGSIIYGYLTGFMKEFANHLNLSETFECFRLDARDEVPATRYNVKNLRHLSKEQPYTVRWTQIVDNFGKFNKFNKRQTNRREQPCAT